MENNINGDYVRYWISFEIMVRTNGNYEINRQLTSDFMANYFYKMSELLNNMILTLIPPLHSC